MNLKHFSVISCASILIVTSISLVAQTAGEQWEYHGTMQMMGMTMPIPVTKVCQEPQQDMTPPVEGNCEVTDIQNQGNTTSFTMRCGPPEPMEGSGTTTRTDNHVEMNYILKSEMGEMAFTMTGNKLGDCKL